MVSRSCQTADNQYECNSFEVVEDKVGQQFRGAQGGAMMTLLTHSWSQSELAGSDAAGE